MSEKQFVFSNKWFEQTAQPIWDQLIPQLKPKKILEIGSFEGASACYLIVKCASTGPLEIHCVDTWEGGTEHKASGTDMVDVERRFLDNTQLACERAAHSVTLVTHKGLSSICLAAMQNEQFFNNFDLIYIDGSHNAPDVLSDAVLSFPLLKLGGTMIFDDYLWTGGNTDPLACPKLAIDAFLNIFFHKMKISWAPNSQVVARKTSN
jgi:predicted O-methyltransferase YrrM